MERVATDCEPLSNRVWAEFFGFIRLIMTIVSTLVHQALYFFAWITSAFCYIPTQILSDSLLKPVFHLIYSAIIAPMFVLILSLNRAVRVVIKPFFLIFEDMCNFAVRILAAWRLCDVNLTTQVQGGAHVPVASTHRDVETV